MIITLSYFPVVFVCLFPFQIAALMCMCQAEQVDGTPDPETNVDE